MLQEWDWQASNKCISLIWEMSYTDSLKLRSLPIHYSHDRGMGCRKITVTVYTNQCPLLQLWVWPADEALWRKCLVRLQSRPPLLPIFQDNLRNLVNHLTWTLILHNLIFLLNFLFQTINTVFSNKNVQSKIR